MTRTLSTCLLVLTLAPSLSAADVTKLPRDPQKEVWVRSLLERLSLNFEVRVVRDPDLSERRHACATAQFKDSIGYITIDPDCVTGISDPWSLGVLGHEAGHLASQHSYRRAGSDAARKRHQIEAEEFAGMVLGIYGYSLAEALSGYAERGSFQGDPDSPSRAERRVAVEIGWNRAERLAKRSPSLRRQQEIAQQLQSRISHLELQLAQASQAGARDSVQLTALQSRLQQLQQDRQTAAPLTPSAPATLLVQAGQRPASSSQLPFSNALALLIGMVGIATLFLFIFPSPA